MAANALSALGVAQPAFFEAFQHDAPVVGRAARLAGIRNGVVARNESVPTVNLFIDAMSPRQQYGASIVDACQDHTIYAIQCTSGPPSVGSATCGPNAPTLTLTEGPATYVISTAASTRTGGYDVKATLQESCELRGTTEAVCSATFGGSVDKTTTSASTTSTLSGTDYHRFDVAITGGAEKTANPTACAGGKSAAAGLSAKSVAVWSLLGALGVVGFLA
ncbi:hypothetical protein GE09DRAFT_176912 [Coniochaeta sp. 2T2.1]|nr:hypothetical protein GE09DRAFT_176912 [Coniochaeta sp. 2T2.1]